MPAPRVPVPAPVARGPFARKSAADLKAESEGEDGLKRAVGALDLTALGLGAVIGTGIFVIIGEAIGQSGPAIVLSFLLAGITCVFSALSYSELASTIPVSGSAYTYGYATLGELIAWIIGWDLILEYGISVAAVAVGWGGYLQDLLKSVFSIDLPDAIAQAPGEGGTVNLPAVFLVLAVGALLIYGVRESTRANAIMVFLKVGILAFFIVAGVLHFKSENFTPFAPNGVSGTVDAAALIFFAYIGFDAISTAGEESKNPRKDLPIAIIGALAIATLIYILVALVATGLVPAGKLDGSDSPLTDALRMGGELGPWAGDIMSIGALIAITSVVLTVFYGQTRIMFAMSRDGLVPKFFGRLTARRTPRNTTIVFGLGIAALAAFLPLAELAKLVNIGTLFAFVIVNVGVIVLRRTQPDLERGFRVPLVPLFPVIGTLLCVYLMTKLSGETWIRFGIWLAIGVLIYVFYGRTHSRLQRGEGPAEKSIA